MDPQGVVVGQSVKWVITGQKDLPALPSGGTNSFNFVIPLNRPLATSNLTAKVEFNCVELDNGRLVSIPTAVKVTESKFDLADRWQFKIRVDLSLRSMP